MSNYCTFFTLDGGPAGERAVLRILPAGVRMGGQAVVLCLCV